MENIAQYTTVTQPLVEFGTNGSAARQAIGTDFTRWIRTGGIDESKLAASGMDFAMIQIGGGGWVQELFEEQIGVAERWGKPFGFFHIPTPQYGSGVKNAKFVYDLLKARGYENRLVECDFEPWDRDDYGTLISQAEAHDYIQELEQLTGRKHVCYANPNVLLHYYFMPGWIYDYSWILSYYPYNSRGVQYGYFREYLDIHPWTIYCSYMSQDFKEICSGQQFTEKLCAQEYFAVATLPTGGAGIQSGDGYALLMTPEESELWIIGEDHEPPTDPTDWEAELQAVKDDIEQIEANLVTIDNTITNILATLTNFDDRLTKLEAAEPPPPNEYVTATALDKVVAFRVNGHNKAGYPIMVKYEPVIKFEPPQTLQVKSKRVDADGSIDFYEMQVFGAGGVTLYCRADKVQL